MPSFERNADERYRNREGVWYTRRDVPPGRFRRLIDFIEVAGPAAGNGAAAPDSTTSPPPSSACPACCRTTRVQPGEPSAPPGQTNQKRTSQVFLIQSLYKRLLPGAVG
jgi:hypothetical protein